MRSHRLDSVASAPVMDHLIRRECARADRNGEVFSLVLFEVLGKDSRHSSLAARRIARVMLNRARLTDEVGWVGESHVAALLTDTTPEGARAFADGVHAVVAGSDPCPPAAVYTYPRDGAAIARPPKANRIAALFPSAGGNPARRAHKQADNHPHRNGDGPATAIQDAHSASTAVADWESRPDASVGREKARPRVAAASAKIADPVAGVEELLAFPMPVWKRIIDIVSGILLMVIFSPIMAIAAIAIKLSSPGPIIYTQKRSGLGGKPFLIFKFRTMIVGAEKQQQELRKFNEQDGPAFKLTRDPRVTRVGHLLRKSSIDELPQLLNILRGEMSLVGPRPLPIAEQEGCEQWQRHRLNVTPGITCIWQVKGRSQVSFADWVRMDVQYIRRRTILHDLSILFSTIPSVLLRKGAR